MDRTKYFGPKCFCIVIDFAADSILKSFFAFSFFFCLPIPSFRVTTTPLAASASTLRPISSSNRRPAANGRVIFFAHQQDEENKTKSHNICREFTSRRFVVVCCAVHIRTISKKKRYLLCVCVSSLSVGKLTFLVYLLHTNKWWISVFLKPCKGGLDSTLHGQPPLRTGETALSVFFFSK